MSYDLQEKCADNLREAVRAYMVLENLLKAKQKILFQVELKREASVARRHVAVVAHMCTRVGVSQSLINAIINGKES